MLEIKSDEVTTRINQGQDRESLSRIFCESRPVLLNAISNRVGRRMGQRVDPSDVLQEAYISASKRLDQYLENPSVPMIVWVQSICFQVISIFYKHHFLAKKRSVLVEQSQYQSSFASAMHHDSTTSPSNLLIRHEEQEQVFKLVSQMTEADQSILYLRHVEDLSNKEAAERLGINAETAKKRHMRAVKRLTNLADAALQQ